MSNEIQMTISGRYLCTTDRWFLMAVVTVLVVASAFGGYYHALDHDHANNAFGIAIGAFTMTVSILFQWRVSDRAIGWLIGFIILGYGWSFLTTLSAIHAYTAMGCAAYGYLMYLSPRLHRKTDESEEKS